MGLEDLCIFTSIHIFINVPITQVTGHLFVSVEHICLCNCNYFYVFSLAALALIEGCSGDFINVTMRFDQMKLMNIKVTLTPFLVGRLRLTKESCTNL